MNGLVVIGIGNPLRRDDGVGWHVVERLHAQAGVEGMEALWCQQLTPDLAERVSHAGWVCIVDADAALPVGTWSVSILPERKAVSEAWSHEWQPAQLMSFTRTLYGRAPKAAVYAIGGGDFDCGTGLSSEVSHAADEVIEHLKALLRSDESTGEKSKRHA